MAKVEYAPLTNFTPSQFKVREVCSRCPIKGVCQPEIYTIAKGANQKRIRVEGQKSGSTECILPLVISDEDYSKI